jgi:hypothetical protein
VKWVMYGVGAAMSIPAFSYLRDVLEFWPTFGVLLLYGLGLKVVELAEEL